MGITSNRVTHQENITARHTGNARVLVVDDNVDILKLISIRLKPFDFELKTVTSAEEALSTLSLWPADLVVTDLQMPGMSGMELFSILHERDPLLPVIILTAHGTIPEAVEATQSGIASYLTKPFDGEALTKQIQIALSTSGFSTKSDLAKPPKTDSDQWRSKILSHSPLMEALLHQLQSLSRSKSLIAFEGEPGTGKDELARAVHKCSNRSNRVLIQLSCTSVPPDLLEAEMFGVTGQADSPNSSRKGLLAQAHGGTLLLSDINEAPSSFLRKVLGALISKRANPINSNQSYPVDVRGLATGGELGQYGSNNQDFWNLGAKLGVTLVSVPPLRDRREDIPVILNHYLKQADRGVDLQFSNKALQQMLAADWPGNVRQLINVVQQCTQLTKTKIISETLVKSRIVSPIFQIPPLTTAHREFERSYLTEILKVTNGNVTKAANMAKRNRTEFHRLLKKHKIEAKSFRQ